MVFSISKRGLINCASATVLVVTISAPARSAEVDPDSA